MRLEARTLFSLRMPTARTTCSYHLPVPPARTTCPYHLLVPPARTTCPYHLPVPPARTTCSYHLPVPPARTTCSYHSYHLKPTHAISSSHPTTHSQAGVQKACEPSYGLRPPPPLQTDPTCAGRRARREEESEVGWREGRSHQRYLNNANTSLSTYTQPEVSLIPTRSLHPHPCPNSKP